MRFKRDQESGVRLHPEHSRGLEVAFAFLTVTSLRHVGIVLFKRLDTNKNTNNFAEYQQMGVNNCESWISQNANVAWLFLDHWRMRAESYLVPRGGVGQFRNFN